MGLSKINKSTAQSYLVKRIEEAIAANGKRPARSTLLHEIVHVRQVLKFAEGKCWIPFVPSLSSELLKKTKVSRRAWFSPEEYEQLYKATRRRIVEGKRRGWKSHYEDLHDFVLFQANTGLRPDEAANLEIRDVKIVYDHDTRETILDIDVRGKTGVGYCKSTANAVHPFQRLRDRRMAELRILQPELTPDQLEAALLHIKLFRPFKRELFNSILREEGLKNDRDGQPRTAYSLRHTYICFRLMDRANVHQIANNCRTSVEMIGQLYTLVSNESMARGTGQAGVQIDGERAIDCVEVVYAMLTQWSPDLEAAECLATRIVSVCQTNRNPPVSSVANEAERRNVTSSRES